MKLNYFGFKIYFLVNIKIKKEIKTQHKKFSLINKLVLNLDKNEATSNVANRSKRIMLVVIRSIIKNFKILNEFALDLIRANAFKK